MRIARTLLLTAAVAVLAAVGPTATAAPSAAPTAEIASAPEVVVHKGTASANTIDSSCAITRGGATGYRICEYDWFEWVWSDGRVHTFVVGTNYAVYNIVQYASGGNSGWRSLGGAARVGVYPDYVYSPSNLGIWVYGTDYNPWCRGLNGSWGTWHRC